MMCATRRDASSEAKEVETYASRHLKEWRLPRVCPPDPRVSLVKGEGDVRIRDQTARLLDDGEKFRGVGISNENPSRDVVESSLMIKLAFPSNLEEGQRRERSGPA
ncbi:hypothetical protein O181_034921 [Austropuccinia psidii MF-1]|uniref:Uncharacterized protein n=1 Tax=Austropuccinia psidii MF-1 TaxID=1389203 RepID=A0A9Q3H8H2_9BASI|nr:hypothetical protein [Austropuccinia psidii MF-1]